ncbi:Dynein intermediate chain 2, axonemal, partial [Perkinsus chesapeaki]
MALDVNEALELGDLGNISIDMGAVKKILQQIVDRQNATVEATAGFGDDIVKLKAQFEERGEVSEKLSSQLTDVMEKVESMGERLRELEGRDLEGLREKMESHEESIRELREKTAGVDPAIAKLELEQSELMSKFTGLENKVSENGDTVRAMKVSWESTIQPTVEELREKVKLLTSRVSCTEEDIEHLRKDITQKYGDSLWVEIRNAVERWEAMKRRAAIRRLGSIFHNHQRAALWGWRQKAEFEGLREGVEIQIKGVKEEIERSVGDDINKVKEVTDELMEKKIDAVEFERRTGDSVRPLETRLNEIEELVRKLESVEDQPPSMSSVGGRESNRSVNSSPREGRLIEFRESLEGVIESVRVIRDEVLPREYATKEMALQCTRDALELHKLCQRLDSTKADRSEMDAAVLETRNSSQRLDASIGGKVELLAAQLREAEEKGRKMEQCLSTTESAVAGQNSALQRMKDTLVKLSDFTQELIDRFVNLGSEAGGSTPRSGANLTYMVRTGGGYEPKEYTTLKVGGEEGGVVRIPGVFDGGEEKDSAIDSGRILYGVLPIPVVAGASLLSTVKPVDLSGHSRYLDPDFFIVRQVEHGHVLECIELHRQGSLFSLEGQRWGRQLADGILEELALYIQIDTFDKGVPHAISDWLEFCGARSGSNRQRNKAMVEELSYIDTQFVFKNSATPFLPDSGLTGMTIVMPVVCRKSCDYGCRNSTVVAYKRGASSGTGFGGIVSYLLGAKSVILTDLPEGLDRLDESCRCNGLREVEEIQVRSCPWGDMQAVEKLPRQRFDVILCCEVLYKQGEEVYEDLMKTIKATAKPGGIVLVVYEYRGSMLEDQYMFDLLFDEYPDGRMEVLEEGEDDDCERRLLFNDVGVGALPMMDVAESMSYRTLAPALSKLSNGKWLFRLSSDGYMMLEATKNVLDGGDSNSLREKLVGLMTDPSMNHLKWGSGITSVLSGNAPKASELRGNTVMVRSLPAALFPDEEYENIFYQLADAVPTHEVARKKAKSLADACKAALKSGIFDPTMIKDKATVSALQLATPANYDEISMNLQKRLAARVGQNAMASTTLPVVAFAMKQGEVGEEVHGKDETTEMGGISLDPSMFSPNILNRSNRLDLAQEFYEETANASPTFGQNEMHLILSWAISCGGDTRTSGCLAGALAGATYCAFSDTDPKMLASVEGNPDAMSQYRYKNPCTLTFDNIPVMSEHSVNTDTVKTGNKGQVHIEGGWPKEVDYSEAQDTAKWRKRLDKDPQFGAAMKSLCGEVEHFIAQNSTIDMFEDYFSGEEVQHQMQTMSTSTVAVFRDQNEEGYGRTVSRISWHPEGGHKFIASYSVMQFQRLDDPIGQSSFIWDVENPNVPVGELLPPSPLICTQYQTRNPDTLAGGAYNGLVFFFDVRQATKPVGKSSFEHSHHDPVYDFVWLQSKTHSKNSVVVRDSSSLGEGECATTSTDGRVLWWDVRNLSEPTDEVILTDGNRENPKQLGGCCLEWQQEAGPTKYLVGTEQGACMALNKKPKKPVEI